MRRSLLLAGGLLILNAGVNREVQAQLYPVYDSVESRVARANTVVVGRLVSAQAISKSEPLHSQLGALVVEVEEVLRGTAPVRLTIDDQNAIWMNTRARAALCSTCPEHSHRFLITLHTKDSNLTFFDLDEPSAFDVTADLKPLHGGVTILQAAREASLRCGKDGHPYTFSWNPHGTPLLPPELREDSVIVPIDGRQEALARFILRTQSPFYDTGRGEGNDRHDAVMALRPFRSSSNEELLKTLLSDPQTSHSRGQLDYTVRAAAYEVLQAWGIPVERPVLSVSVTEPPDK
jgi:hypothetical protein